MFNKNNIGYAKRTINNSFDLKSQLERLDINEDDVTVVSLDIKDMYPMCKFGAVKDAVNHFARVLSDEQRSTIGTCLEMLKFSMGHTIVQFQDEYYEYGTDDDPDRRGLTIGGFESAFLADLEASYILDKLKILFSNALFHGFYRDDGFVIFRGRRSIPELEQWLDLFQSRTNLLLGTEDIQFTMEVWQPGQDSRTIPSSEVTVNGETFHRMSINGDNVFPYLDLALAWTDEGKLSFGVHSKPNQLTKYLNADSNHHPDQKSAVIFGVELRLASLTTRTADNEGMSLSVLYPEHHRALLVAGQLKPGQLMRTLGVVQDDEVLKKPQRFAKRENRKLRHKREVLCIAKWANFGKSHIPLHKVIKRKRDKHALKWLRVTMVHSRHSNLKEILLGDLNRKLMYGVVDKVTKDDSCNCPRGFKVMTHLGLKCAYGGDGLCRASNTIYNVKCKCPVTHNQSGTCNKFYKGKSQRTVKKRIQEHICDVTKLYYEEKIKPRRAVSIASSSTPSSYRRLRSQFSGSNSTPTSRGATLSTLSSPPSSTSEGETLQLCQVILPSASFDSNISQLTKSTATTDSSSSRIPILPHNRHLFEPDPDPPAPPTTRQRKEPEHWGRSSLSDHLYAHVKDLDFETKADVATWCRKHIEVTVEWRAPAHIAMKTAGTKHCRLCGMERLRLFNAFGYRRTDRNLLNARSEIRGSCTCKTRFLRFTTK